MHSGKTRVRPNLAGMCASVKIANAPTRDPIIRVSVNIYGFILYYILRLQYIIECTKEKWKYTKDRIGDVRT
jgi:hypothetical protein